MKMNIYGVSHLNKKIEKTHVVISNYLSPGYNPSKPDRLNKTGLPMKISMKSK